jgi:cell wall-associated NlpC family hydrolase
MPENAGPARTTDSTQLRPHHVRTLALAGAVVGVVLLPIAAAQATPPSQNNAAQTGAAQAGPGQASATPSASASASPSAGAGVQALTPEFCGAALTKAVSGGTVHVQVCVEQSDGSAAARVYVANGSSTAQVVVLNLTRADGSVVQVQCTIAVGDAAGQCATSPTAISAGSGAYDAIAELVGQNAPVSAGVVHAESGLVAPTAP